MTRKLSMGEVGKIAALMSTHPTPGLLARWVAGQKAGGVQCPYGEGWDAWLERQSPPSLDRACAALVAAGMPEEAVSAFRERSDGQLSVHWAGELSAVVAPLFLPWEGTQEKENWQTALQKAIGAH